MRMLVLLILVFCVSCASVSHTGPVIENPFSEYIKRFKLYADNYSQTKVYVDVIIRFGFINVNTYAECTLDPILPEIVIDPAIWYIFNDWEREELVFHELGHCVLNREHNDEMVSFGEETVFKSIMHTYGMMGGEYKRYHQHFIVELFRFHKKELIKDKVKVHDYVH